MKVKILLMLLLSCLIIQIQAQYDLLNRYINNYRYKEALDYIDEQNADRSLLLQKAFCYKELDDYNRAIDVLLSLEKDYPEDVKIKMELASCYQAQSNWDAGLSCYDNLIEIDSSTVYYKKQRADILFRKGNYREALQAYKYLSDVYNMDNMIKRSAQCFEYLKQPDSAIVYYKDAWAKDSSDVFSVSSLISLSIKSGGYNLQEAKRYGEIYIKRDSTNKQVNLLNALSYYADDMYEEAIDLFEKCYEAGDSSLVLNRSLGVSYYSMGMNIQAQPFLEKAYVADSTNNNIIYCLAVISNEMAEYDDGVKYFSTLLKRVVPSNMVQYLYYRGLGNGYKGARNMEAFIESFEKASTYATDNQKMSLFYDMAVVYEENLKQNNKALVYYIQYKDLLNRYLSDLKSKENGDNTEMEEINSLENKLKKLDLHIQELKSM